MVCVIVQLPRGGRAPLRVGSMYNLIFNLMVALFVAVTFADQMAEESAHGPAQSSLVRPSFPPCLNVCPTKKKDNHI